MTIELFPIVAGVLRDLLSATLDPRTPPKNTLVNSLGFDRHTKTSTPRHSTAVPQKRGKVHEHIPKTLV